MANPLPAISLPIGGGKTWDDRELVNAYDAALLEFHIHNPGPGSWLDKATAALAKGQPLPGATDFGTAWYSASKPAEEEEEDGKEPPKKKSKKSKPAPKRPKAASPTYQPPSPTYQPASPTYQPASPGGQAQWDAVGWPPAEDESEEEEEEGEKEEEEWQGYDGYGEAEGVGQVFPAPAGQWPGRGSVARDEAIGYALHAQYWAGYWMGIAHASGAGASEAAESADAEGTNGAASVANQARGGVRPRGKGRNSNALRR